MFILEKCRGFDIILRLLWLLRDARNKAWFLLRKLCNLRNVLYNLRNNV